MSPPLTRDAAYSGQGVLGNPATLGHRIADRAWRLAVLLKLFFKHVGGRVHPIDDALLSNRQDPLAQCRVLLRIDIVHPARDHGDDFAPSPFARMS